MSSDTCRSCHPEQYRSWADSYHRTMTQIATPETVLAPLDGDALSLEGVDYQMVSRGDEVWAIIDSLPDSQGNRARVETPIVLTTGSHHFQAYWIPTGNARRVRLFELAYYVTEQRWLPMDSLPLAPPGVSQAAEEGGRWNETCLRCHTTGAQPWLFKPTGTETRVAEFGIACESCHGPAREHILANRDPKRRYRMHLSDAPDPTIVDPASLSAEASSQVCGQCHSVFDFHDDKARGKWSKSGFSYRPGDDLHAERKIIDWESASPLYRETKFWPDGQIKVNGREYNSLLDSPCFEGRQLSCMSCHEMHQNPSDPRTAREWADDQLAQGMRGNEACLGCHPFYRETERLVQHTHHPADSAGSLCYNCHMPHTAWGLQKATRSHQVSNPDVATQLATGRPNACNLCHLDKTAQWTAEHLKALYEIAVPPLTPVQKNVANSILWALSGDASQRALAAWHLGWKPAIEASESGWIAPYLAQLLVDPYPAVRSAAANSLENIGALEPEVFDPSSTPAALKGARSQVVKQWQQSRPGGSAAKPATLIGPQGRLRWAIVRQLLNQRDNRVIYLAE
ncbi:ammonia-forming cytochrome c nitrite reductase subunit c552 [Myxococcota bacterium]|nr:ammonia-forming cytochrome c nitrite reductase subunit c552 [Myxococcota bacterium]